MSFINMFFYISLLITGIQIIRKKDKWFTILIFLFGLEIFYLFSTVLIICLSLLIPSLEMSANILTTNYGTANAGLLPQIICLYPIWGILLILLVKRNLSICRE